MTKPIEIRKAMQSAVNQQRRLDYYKRRLVYDVHRDMADLPAEDRTAAIDRGHQLLDQGLPRIRAYYYAYKGIML